MDLRRSLNNIINDGDTTKEAIIDKVSTVPPLWLIIHGTVLGNERLLQKLHAPTAAKQSIKTEGPAKILVYR